MFSKIERFIVLLLYLLVFCGCHSKDIPTQEDVADDSEKYQEISTFFESFETDSVKWKVETYHWNGHAMEGQVITDSEINYENSCFGNCCIIAEIENTPYYEGGTFYYDEKKIQHLRPVGMQPGQYVSVSVWIKVCQGSGRFRVGLDFKKWNGQTHKCLRDVFSGWVSATSTWQYIELAPWTDRIYSSRLACLCIPDSTTDIAPWVGFVGDSGTVKFLIDGYKVKILEKE